MVNLSQSVKQLTISMPVYLGFFMTLLYPLLMALSWTSSLLSLYLLTGVLFTFIFCPLFSSHFLWVLSCSSYAAVLLIIFVAICCFSSCVRMSSIRSALVSFFSCSQRYWSADICVGLICCLFHVTNLLVFVMRMMYDLLWWLWSPLPSIVLWVHGPPSSCWTATVDPMGRYTNFLEVSLSFSFLLAFLLLLYDVHHHYLYQLAVY